MPGRHRRSGSRAPAVRLAMLGLAVAAGAVALTGSGGTVLRQSAALGTAGPGTAGPVVLDPPPAPSGAVPVSVDLPSIGVRSTLVGLSTDAAGALVPPQDFARAGWFDQGTVPGEIGPAVIAGHVDSYRGPAVFFRLRDLAVGDRVTVTRSDGRVATFAVTRVARYPKSDFPTAAVYGPVADPQLRLITCGGEFDRSRRSYLDDVVVYAHLLGMTPAR